EPLVQSPVAIAFDERGRMYVAENRGYPDPLEGEPASAPQGIVALLTDTDGDGRYDRRTDFATGLTYPNGVMPWAGGVFVTVAPDLLYLKDTDGDGIADERRVVLTGFNATKTAQIRFSHPTLGPDGWIYLTTGLNGGRVTSPAHPERPPIEFSSSDSRYNPRTGDFQLVGGQGQFGLTFDDYGRRFICANRNPVWHVVLDPQQLKRNPHLAFSDTVQDVSGSGGDTTVWPLSRDLTTASFHPSLMSAPHAGTFTSASGVHIHRGDALPDGHRGSIFIAESAQNLVQRQVLEADGVSFRSRPARKGSEFLASRDTWFRPVFLTDGPDGGLYVVDMYRKDIDHPAYVPQPSRREFDFIAGRNRGRIYRVAAENRPPRGTPVNLADASVETLVSKLQDPNGWWRDTAQRLLTERNERMAAAKLRELAERGSEFGRLHAHWTMDAIGVLRDDDLVRAMHDRVAGVRENAVRIAERYEDASGKLRHAVTALANDPDPRVRLHAALALGATDDPRNIAPLAAIARRDGDNRWTRAAVLSSVREHTRAFLDAFTAGAAASPAVRGAVMQDVARVVGASEPVGRCLALVTQIAEPGVELTWQPGALAALAAGLRARGVGSGVDSALMALVASDVPEARVARERLMRVIAGAADLSVRDQAPLDQRLGAIELLGQAQWSMSGATLLQLLEPQRATEIKIAAVRALAQTRDPAAATSLVTAARWQTFTPRVREAILTAFLAEERLVSVLLDAIERGDIAASALGPSRWQRLREHRNASIRQRAEALHTVADAGSPVKVYDRRLPDVLARNGNAESGSALFTKYCGACHTFDGAGGRVGPDLSGVRNQPVDALLLHIIVPDYEIAPGFAAYAVQTRDEHTLFGRLESEAPGSITLKDAAGQSHTILRADVKSMTAATSSLMPAGLEQTMSSQDLADLIAYLKRLQQP
ncbi:MAG TPA: PVC-type heme-binding CxxCH protein, partial [Gemmatimonadaceae bacterium]|nr:PVC-type heme-binding CxxCH protein [Gemmatimonadaceae bacterium]